MKKLIILASVAYLTVAVTAAGMTFYLNPTWARAVPVGTHPAEREAMPSLTTWANAVSRH